MGAVGIVFIIFYLILLAVVIVGGWKVFTKAGKPGWAAIVPIYNFIVLLEIVDKPLWWIILLLIFPVNIVVGIILAIELAKKFGKETGFGLGLFFLSFIFVPLLGFGSAKYLGAAAGGATPPPPPPPVA
ncbi:MAG: signal peptidase I [Planctomycetes bacterium]|nr:signal peptidase I [Planctomycetota bacterium]